MPITLPVATRPPAESTGLEEFQATAVRMVTRNSILREAYYFFVERMTSGTRWYIFPTFLFGLVGSFTLEHQVHVAFLFAFSLLIVAYAWMILGKPRLTLAARYPERVAAGEAMRVEIDIVNRSTLPIYDLAIVPHRWPGALSYDDEKLIPVARIGGHGSAHQRLEIVCVRRGVYELSGFRGVSAFPFGVLNAYSVTQAPHPILVYPEFTPLRDMDIRAGRKYHPGGVALASNLGESFEYIGSREYREGDNIRDLDWNASARLNRPIVREYREEYFHRVGVVLDTHVPRSESYPQLDAFEHAVSLTAAIGDYMARQEYLVDIFAAGPSLYHLTAGRSLAYLDQILDILACVDATHIEPFATLEPEILEYLAQITTIVFVFLDWNDTRRRFVERVSANGAAVKVIIVRDLPLTEDPVGEPHLGLVPIIDTAMYDAGVTRL